jgi:hypothetical protein
MSGVPIALILLFAFSAATFAFLGQSHIICFVAQLALIVGKALEAPRFSFGSLVASSFLPREASPAPTAILIRFGFLTPSGSHGSRKSIASH